MVRVFAARRDQFAVDAVFDDLAVFEDDDPVEACDRGEAVRVEDHRHVMGVTEGVVDILHYGGEHVEAQRQVVRVGEHHDEGSGADAEPRVSARQEEGQDGHDHDDHGGGDGA